MVWAAAEGIVEYSVGDTGVPVLDVVPEDFSLAEVEGTGSQLCAGVGFAGSSGGAFKLFFGTDATG